ncbi:DUF7322 domain-containing protein [Halomarina rubra]|uniref:DUF7322 domain-containing protein n=1 Tax=Halomarina rubra TaxID=2071873 RepID=A0ABD6ARK9_9EURY|nr:hypothetical protein [Halomarina rubra]
MIDPFEEDRDDDPWPDEPEEFDPDSLAPSVDIPEANDLSESDVSDGLFKAFWGSVVFLNVALLGLSLGAMLLYFRGDVWFGGGSLLVGAVGAVFAYRYYAMYDPEEEQEEEESMLDDDQRTSDQ